MSELVKGKTAQWRKGIAKRQTAQWRKGYDVGYEAACRDIRRRMTQSHGAKLERAYFGADAPPVELPEVREAEVSTR